MALSTLGGGVGFLIRNGVPVKIIGSPTSLLALLKTVHQLSVYIAHLGFAWKTFFQEFFALIEFLLLTSDSFVICGDFNIHVDNITRDSVRFLDTIQSCDIIQHINPLISMVIF